MHDGLSQPSPSLRLALFLVLLFPAVMCLNTRGSSDMLYWNTWADKVVRLGPVKGYEDIRRDYPPLASMTVGAAYWMGAKWNLDVTASIKVALLLVYGVSLLVFWKLTRHYWATVLAAAGLLVHAVALGYLDIVYMSFLIGAVTAFVGESWLWFAILYSLTCLVKWQPLILAPFFALHLLRQHVLVKDWKAGAVRMAKKVALPAALILGVTIFIFGSKPVGDAFRMAFRGEDHRALSLQALNLPWVATHVIEWLAPDKYPAAGRNLGMASLDQGEAQPMTLPSERVHVLTRLPFLLMYLFLLFRVWRSSLSPWKTLIGAMLGYMSYFMLATGVHENHLFTAVVLAIFLFASGQVRAEVPVVLALILNANLLMFYRLDGAKLHEGDRAFMKALDPALLTAAANVVAAFCILWAMLRLLPAKQPSAEKAKLPDAKGGISSINPHDAPAT